MIDAAERNRRGSTGRSGAGRLSWALPALAVCFSFLTPAFADADVVEVDLVAKRETVKIAPGVEMKAWTFNGTVPGPVIRAVEGDTIEVTLRNADKAMAHSVDFHAAQISPQVGFADVLPGETRTFSFVARRPGVFLYHCGTSPVLEHIGMGMYGAILVDPEQGRPPARERVLVQSEFYGPVKHGMIKPSYEAMRTQEPTFTAFNGRAFRYRDKPIEGDGRQAAADLRGRGRADTRQRLPHRRRDLRHGRAGRQPAQRDAGSLDLRRAGRRRRDVRAHLRRGGNATRSSPIRSAGPMRVRSD